MRRGVVVPFVPRAPICDRSSAMTERQIHQLACGGGKKCARALFLVSRLQPRSGLDLNEAEKASAIRVARKPRLPIREVARAHSAPQPLWNGCLLAIKQTLPVGSSVMGRRRQNRANRSSRPRGTHTTRLLGPNDADHSSLPVKSARAHFRTRKPQANISSPCGRLPHGPGVMTRKLQ